MYDNEILKIIILINICYDSVMLTIVNLKKEIVAIGYANVIVSYNDSLNCFSFENDGNVGILHRI